jgi:Uma2 family endonuclease
MRAVIPESLLAERRKLGHDRFDEMWEADVVVARPEHTSSRGVEGPAGLVVEIRSPDDETYEKFPFYEQVGVREVLVVELDRSLRHWRRQEDTLVELPARAGGWVQLATVPIRLRPDEAGGFAMEGPFGISTLD